MVKKANTITLRIPRWASRLYIALGLILVPWTVYLGLTLPKKYTTIHWDVSWVGLDIALVITLLATGILAYAKSMWVIIAASASGSLLLMDAWFDVVSERQIFVLHLAMSRALLIEVPLAFMSFYLAFHTIKRNTKK